MVCTFKRTSNLSIRIGITFDMRKEKVNGIMHIHLKADS